MHLSQVEGGGDLFTRLTYDVGRDFNLFLESSIFLFYTTAKQKKVFV